MTTLSKVHSKAFNLLWFMAEPLASDLLAADGRPAMFAMAILRPAFAKRAGALFQLFSSCLDRLGRYLGQRIALEWLRELDDRALRDIGLGRSQIDAAVSGFMDAREPTQH